MTGQQTTVKLLKRQVSSSNKEMLQKTFKKVLTVTRWDDKIKKSLDGDGDNGLWKLNRI